MWIWIAGVVGLLVALLGFITVVAYFFAHDSEMDENLWKIDSWEKKE